MTTNPVLSARDIHKTYRRTARPTQVLSGVSLELAPGDFASIEGASGCGKSTLLLILGGLLSPDRGDVTVAGHALTGVSTGVQSRVRARFVGFVFQQFHLVPYLTLEENILAGGLTLGEPPDRARAAEFLQRFGLADRADHLPGRLSVGEQQRTALARALYHRPHLLLADEPTGNLDPANGTIVLDAFAEFASAGGAVLLVTHQPSAAARAPSRFLLRDGRLHRSDSVVSSPPTATDTAS